MPISFKRQSIFIHIPKNAGTAIAESASCDFSDHGHHRFEYYKLRYPFLWAHYKKFAIVRNPWDRTVSNYEYARMRESYWHSVSGAANNPLGQSVPHPDLELAQSLSFKDLIKKFSQDRKLLKHHGWKDQWPYVLKNGELCVDKIFLIEDIATSSEFKEIVPDLKTKNRSKKQHSDYSDYYDEESKHLVAEIYKEDIEYFNLKF